ncbi:MAG: TRAP transporter small permease [Bacillota bacterium]
MGKALQTIEKAVGAFLSLAVFVILIVQVFFRYVLDHPITWADELASYTFIWMVFIGAAYAQQADAHVKMDIVLNALPKRFKDVTRIAMDLLILAFLVAVIPAGFNLAGLMKPIRTPGLRISWAVVLVSAPVGFILAGLHIGGDVVKGVSALVRTKRQPRTK